MGCARFQLQAVSAICAIEKVSDKTDPTPDCGTQVHILSTLSAVLWPSGTNPPWEGVGGEARVDERHVCAKVFALQVLEVHTHLQMHVGNNIKLV